jgi:hypothetical protein
MKLTTNNLSHSALYIGYKENYIEETASTKFCGLQIHWKNHIEQTITTLHAVCYAVRLMVHISKTDTAIYLHLHYVVKYGILFEGKSSSSMKIFTLQRKAELWLVYNPQLHEKSVQTI